MKAFIVLALVALASADVSHLRPQSQSGGPDNVAVIRSQVNDVGPDSFQYSYETSNGISGQEAGQIKNPGQENEALSVQGANAWTAPDGTPVQLTYTADEFGYQPQGSHIPTSPPIPAAIQRALEYIAANPPPKEVLQKKF